MFQVAVAAKDFERPLVEELGPRFRERFGRIFEYESGPLPVWAQNHWLEPQRFNFKSISEASKHLRSIQRNWAHHPTAAFRRAQLIQDSLPPLKPKLVEFMSEIPTAPLGSWTLLDEGTMLYSGKCSSPFADGEVQFAENKMDPPSRAYLKLWELFTVERFLPKAGDRVMDLGSSPGGWTWVLDQLGCDVLSIDKAPLANTVKWSKRVEYRSESAFGLDPTSVGKVDWLFSDIICYPERLLQLVKRWEPFAKHFVCTIKCQGPTDHTTIREFAELPGAKIRHLFHNKHELTWTR